VVHPVAHLQHAVRVAVQPPQLLACKDRQAGCETWVASEEKIACTPDGVSC